MGLSYTMHLGNNAFSCSVVGAIIDWMDRAYRMSSTDCM